jgi:hypothetical protein
MDAPLTLEVVALLRDAPGGPLTDVFAHQMSALSELSDTFRGMGDRFNRERPKSGEWSIQLAQALAQILGLVSRRMADVLMAVAGPPALPRRAWTPAEIEAARADWTRRVEQAREAGTIGLWPRGPMLDTITDVMGQPALDVGPVGTRAILVRLAGALVHEQGGEVGREDTEEGDARGHEHRGDTAAGGRHSAAVVERFASSQPG